MLSLALYLLVAVGSICFVWYGVFFLYLHPFRCNVPGPLPLPLIGNWLHLTWPKRDTLEPTGLKKIECYWLGVLGMKPMVFVCDPHLVREIAIDKRHVFLDRGTKELVGFMAGDSQQSILTSHGELWQRQRDALTRVLADSDQADSFFDDVLDQSPDLVNALKNEPTAGCPFATHVSGPVSNESTEETDSIGTSVGVSEVIYRLLSKAGAKSFFGFEDPGTDDKLFHENECLRKDRAWAYWSVIASLPMLPTSWWRRISSAPLIRRFTNHREMDAMHRDQRELVQQQLGQQPSKCPIKRVLGGILKLRQDDFDAGVPIADANERMVANIIGLTNGSAKNEAAIACYGLQQLASNPHIQLALSDEICSVLGGSPPLSRKQLLSMPYLAAVTKEMLRLKPGFPVMSKVAGESTTLSGFALAQGTEIAIRARTLQSHPAYWDRPEEFRPERHLDGNARQRHPYAYIPFGLGIRKCPGSLIARVGISLAVCQIIQNFRVEPLASQAAPKPLLSLAVGFDGISGLKFIERQHDADQFSVAQSEEWSVHC